MHPSPSKAGNLGNLASRVQSRNGLPFGIKNTPLEIGLDSAERFTSQDAQPHRYQWPGIGIQYPMRPGHADQAVAQVATRSPNRDHLGILAYIGIHSPTLPATLPGLRTSYGELGVYGAFAGNLISSISTPVSERQGPWT
jgi:hypothetical protein